MEPVSPAREGGLNLWTTRDGPAFPLEFQPPAHSSLLWTCRDAQPVSGSARPTQPRRGSLGSGAFSLAEGCLRREGVGRSPRGDRCLSLSLASLREARCARSPRGTRCVCGPRRVRCACGPSGDAVCVRPERGRGVRCARSPRRARCVRAARGGRGVCAAQGGCSVRAAPSGDAVCARPERGRGVCVQAAEERRTGYPLPQEHNPPAPAVY